MCLCDRQAQGARGAVGARVDAGLRGGRPPRGQEAGLRAPLPLVQEPRAAAAVRAVRGRRAAARGRRGGGRLLAADADVGGWI